MVETIVGLLLLAWLCAVPVQLLKIKRGIDRVEADYRAQVARWVEADGPVDR